MRFSILTFALCNVSVCSCNWKTENILNMKGGLIELVDIGAYMTRYHGRTC